MDDSIYNKSVTCPACSKSIEVTKVKSKACIVSSRDTDFSVNYANINPMFYEAWVCEFCGYAALFDGFEGLNHNGIKKVKEFITPFWKSRKFSGERSVDDAIQAFKLALYNLQKIGAPPSDFAKVCLRLAWLYRIKKDEKEMEFLKYTLNYYNDAYQKEKFPIGKLDESTCMYMLGELSRRIGDYEQSVMWFSKVISSPGAKNNKQLLENARDQYHLAKEHLVEV